MLLALSKLGYTLDEIGSMVGLSRYQVHRRIMKERWESGEVVITDRKLRAMVDEGLTIRQMAERNFCCHSIIHDKLKKAGLSTGPPGNPNLTHRPNIK